MKETAGTVSPVVEARKRMLAFLPRIISSLALLWKAVGHSDGRYTATGRKDSCWRMGSPKVGTPVDVLAVYRLSATLMAATLRREGRTRVGGWVHLRWVHQWMFSQCIGHSDGRYTVMGRKDSYWRMGSPKVGTPVDVLAVYRPL